MTTIDQTFQQLAENHPATLERYWELLRGSLPRNSVPGGIRGAEMPMPALDAFDRTLIAARAQYDSWSRILMATSSARRQREAADRLVRLQAWFLLRPEPIPDIKCEDEHCVEVLELGRKSGKCAKHRMRAIRKAKREAKIA